LPRRRSLPIDAWKGIRDRTMLVVGPQPPPPIRDFSRKPFYFQSVSMLAVFSSERVEGMSSSVVLDKVRTQKHQGGTPLPNHIIHMFGAGAFAIRTDVCPLLHQIPVEALRDRAAGVHPVRGTADAAWSVAPGCRYQSVGLALPVLCPSSLIGEAGGTGMVAAFPGSDDPSRRGSPCAPTGMSPQAGGTTQEDRRDRFLGH
jgi:hypothetical protein